MEWMLDIVIFLHKLNLTRERIGFLQEPEVKPVLNRNMD